MYQEMIKTKYGYLVMKRWDRSVEHLYPTRPPHGE
jgi:hypothetical protein